MVKKNFQVDLKKKMSGDGDKHTEDGDELERGVAVKTRTKTKKPSMYKVLMLNDDYTPMEFVVHVLENFFNKNHENRPEAQCYYFSPDSTSKCSYSNIFINISHTTQ